MHIRPDGSPDGCRVALLTRLGRDEVSCRLGRSKSGLVAVGAIGRHAGVSEIRRQPRRSVVASIAVIR